MKVVINGTVYNRILDYAAELGLSRNSLRKYLVHNDDGTYTCEYERRRYGRCFPCTVHGTEYPSIKDACDAYGRNIGKVYNRVQAGWSVEDAIDVD